MPVWRAIAVLGCLLSLSSLGGCSSDGPPKEDETTQELGYIDRAYGVIQSGQNRPPKDLAEIEKTLDELHTDGLNPPAKEVLTSTRDGQPYVIIVGVNVDGTDPGSVLAYEKAGAEGKRYVLMASHKVAQLTDEQFRQAIFAKGHKPE